MNGLGMLAQVIESREAPLAVTLEWSLARVFPGDDVSAPVLANKCKIETHSKMRAADMEILT
jgi:hypothetical protein